MSKPLEGKTVLCADDDLNILTLVGRHVRSLGAEVVECGEGDEALMRAKELAPDLIVLDVMMPGMSGWEVCRAIRKDPHLDKSGVIMLTGIGEALNEMTSPLNGADAFLDKPFDLEDLEDALLQVLALRSGADADEEE